jgi:hypothetical protein
MVGGDEARWVKAQRELRRPFMWMVGRVVLTRSKEAHVTATHGTGVIVVANRDALRPRDVGGVAAALDH